MYEDKGGLVFHKDVDAEPFIYDDEFYFTVDNAAVGTGPPLSGEYKAYPERAYGELWDVDAWRVLFEDGRIVNIAKNDGFSWPADPVTHFTLRDGEGIMLYVPGGTYTVRKSPYRRIETRTLSLTITPSPWAICFQLCLKDIQQIQIRLQVLPPTPT